MTVLAPAMRTVRTSSVAAGAISRTGTAEVDVFGLVMFSEADRLSGDAPGPGVGDSDNADCGIILGVSDQARPDQESAEHGAAQPTPDVRNHRFVL
jgi:hypothetical protein